MIQIAIPPMARGKAEGRHVDVVGAALCALGLAGPVFALIEQPRLGWSSPAVVGPLVGGLLVLLLFLFYESRSPDPMLPSITFILSQAQPATTARRRKPWRPWWKSSSPKQEASDGVPPDVAHGARLHAMSRAGMNSATQAKDHSPEWPNGLLLF